MDEGRSTPTARLAVMMLLQYAVWGAWLPVAARYLSAAPEAGGLGFSGDQIGLILGLAGSIGAVAAPFIAGQVADRLFRAEHALAGLLVAGAVVQWTLAGRTTYEDWLWLSILYSVLYMPTLALSNSIAFAHVRDANREFPKIRVWGTLGWIAASWTFPMIWLQRDLVVGSMPPFLTGPEVEGATARLADALRFSAMLSAAYAIVALRLPATPPRRGASLAFAAAFRLFSRPSFAVLVVASLAISTIHNVYFMQGPQYLTEIGLGVSQIGPAMTIGQFSEILVMAALGLILAKFGFRIVLTIGAAAYFARYAIWQAMDLAPTLLVASLALHGVCYACFFATAFIYVDRLATPDIRHSAQTVFGIVILGGGPVLGGMLSGRLEAHYRAMDGARYFEGLWWVLALIGLATAVLTLLFFRDEARAPEAMPVPEPVPR
jgi:nucleoside transporter